MNQNEALLGCVARAFDGHIACSTYLYLFTKIWLQCSFPGSANIATNYE
jgi:hypothetical protein